MPSNPEKLREIISSPQFGQLDPAEAVKQLMPYSDHLGTLAPNDQITQVLEWKRLTQPPAVASGGAPAVPQGNWWDEFVTGARRGSAEPVHVAGNLVNALAGVPAAQPLYNLEKSLRAPSKAPSNWVGEALPSAAMYGAPWLGGPVAGIVGDAAIAGVGALDRGLGAGIESTVLGGLTARFGPKAIKALIPTRLIKAVAGSSLKDMPSRLARSWYQMPAKAVVGPAVPTISKPSVASLPLDFLTPDERAAKLAAFEAKSVDWGKKAALPAKPVVLSPEQIKAARGIPNIDALAKKLIATEGADSPTVEAIKGYKAYLATRVDPTKAGGYTGIKSKLADVFEENVRSHFGIEPGTWNMLDLEKRTQATEKYMAAIYKKIAPAVEEVVPFL